MHRLTAPLEADANLEIDFSLMRLRISRDLDAELMSMLDIAIRLMSADMGTLQRYDDLTDSLRLVAGRGFSSRALAFFGIVRRDTNSSCAAALTQRMRVFVEDIATSYLFAGTAELDMLRAEGIAAAQSTPLISQSGRLWGVMSTHFRTPQTESAFDHSPLDQLAALIADGVEQRERLETGGQTSGVADGGK